jgi:ornithine cyclodeaminase/alanine dehydrogenase-like protein (mu-crystallin family)
VSIRFRLLTESDVKAVLTMDDLIATMTSALQRFSTGRVVQPVRPTIPIADDAFFATMPAFVRRADQGEGTANFGAASPPSSAADGDRAALGAKLVTVFGSNAARGLHSHLATIVLLDPETGALLALLDGRFITEARTAAVSAVSSRLLARTNASSLAIIGTGVQAGSHLEALSRVHQLRSVTVWSPNQRHRDQFVAIRSRSGRDQMGNRSDGVYTLNAVEHAGEAVVGADVIVLVTSSPTPVLENGWVKPGAHVISVGACRPNQREMDPALVARARLFVDSRAAALVEAGDVVMGIQEGRFTAGHIVAEIGELLERGATAAAAPYEQGSPESAGRIAGRTSETEITIFKSLGLAVEDVTAADLAYRRAVERGIGTEQVL